MVGFLRGSPKERLHGVLGKSGLGLPKYDPAGQTGPSHSPVYKVNAWVGSMHGQGTGRSKKEAEQAAAASLLTEVEHHLKHGGLPAGTRATEPVDGAPAARTEASLSLDEVVSAAQVALLRLSKVSGSMRVEDLFARVKGVPEESRSKFLHEVQDLGLVILDEVSGEVLPMSGLPELAKDQARVASLVRSALSVPEEGQAEEEPAEEEPEEPEEEPAEEADPVDGDGAETEAPEPRSLAKEAEDLEPKISKNDFERLLSIMSALDVIRGGGEFSRDDMFNDEVLSKELQRSYLKVLCEEGVIARHGERHLTRYLMKRDTSAAEVLGLIFPGRYDLEDDHEPSSIVPARQDADPDTGSGSTYVPNRILAEIRDQMMRFLDILEHQAREISDMKKLLGNQDGR